MKKYLEVSEFIDWQASEIIMLARKLADNKTSDAEVAKKLL